LTTVPLAEAVVLPFAGEPEAENVGAVVVPEAETVVLL
jgi:hypothetical protein